MCQRHKEPGKRSALPPDELQEITAWLMAAAERVFADVWDSEEDEVWDEK